MAKLANNYYVYVYSDPRVSGKFVYGEYTFQCEPFYIGKGKNRRMFEHIRLLDKENYNYNPHKTRKIKQIINATGSKPLIFKLKDGLSEKEALAFEVEIIKTIGRYDLKTGPLLNLSDGGDGSSNISESGRQKLRAKMIGDKNPNWKGKSINENSVHRRRLNGPQNYFYGKTHTEQTKKAISLSRKNESVETKKKRSDSFKEVWRTNRSKFCQKYKLISPTGQVFFVDEGLENFCRIHGLNQPILSKMLRDKNYRPSRGNCVGWSIYRPDSFEKTKL